VARDPGGYVMDLDTKTSAPPETKDRTALRCP
jgi:hypothetical protein